MTNIFTVLQLEYDESADVINCLAENDQGVRVAILHGFSSNSSIRQISDHVLEPLYLPRVLLAFAHEFQLHHDEQNAGDSPALTSIENFGVDDPSPPEMTPAGSKEIAMGVKSTIRLTRAEAEARYVDLCLKEQERIIRSTAQLMTDEYLEDLLESMNDEAKGGEGYENYLIRN